ARWTEGGEVLAGDARGARLEEEAEAGSLPRAGSACAFARERPQVAVHAEDRGEGAREQHGSLPPPARARGEGLRGGLCARKAGNAAGGPQEVPRLARRAAGPPPGEAPLDALGAASRGLPRRAGRTSKVAEGAGRAPGASLGNSRRLRDLPFPPPGICKCTASLGPSCR